MPSARTGRGRLVREFGVDPGDRRCVGACWWGRQKGRGLAATSRVAALDEAGRAVMSRTVAGLAIVAAGEAGVGQISLPPSLPLIT